MIGIRRFLASVKRLLFRVLYCRYLTLSGAQTLAIKVSGAAPPVWTEEAGLPPQFCAEFGLTSREKQAEKLLQGKSNKQIADGLLVSVKTVEPSLNRAYTGRPVRRTALP
ncbi:helix-turn-helix transcriptional regulator [Breznakiellaceae bacterium SP9]